MTLFGLIILAMLAPASGAPPAAPEALIGADSIHVVQPSDTLLDVARNADVGYVAIRAANPGVDPWLPEAGRTLRLPTRHLLPDAPRRGIVINLPELRLYYFPPSGAVQSYPIGIGGEGKETPVGTSWVEAKRTHPIWYPTATERADEPDLPEMVPPGPDNPMGDYAIYLSRKGYAIHGSNRPYSIGRRDSNGCIRLYPEDIARLFAAVPLGARVTVVDQPVKLGWSQGELYLEIHPTQREADLIEGGAEIPPESAPAVDDLVLAAAGSARGRIDWYAVDLAAQQRNGMPVRITRPVRP